MSTENMIHALDVSESSPISTNWVPVVLKPGFIAPPLSGVGSPEQRQPTQARKATPSVPQPMQEEPLRKNASIEEMADYHPGAVAHALEAFLEHNQAEGDHDHVAAFVIGLGPERAGSILRLMSESDAVEVARSVAERQTVSTQEKEDALEMFRKRLVSGDIALRGGTEFARKMLHKAFGPTQGDVFMSRVRPEERSGFDLVREATVDELLPFVEQEHPQAMALILSQLHAHQAAGVLNRLPLDLQAEVAYRIAKMDTISPLVMRELENRLAQDLRGVMSGQIIEMGGPRAVAEILNRSDRTTEKEILKRIEAQDAPMAEQVRNQIFVFDDIFNLAERDFAAVVEALDAQEWAVALKGAPETIMQLFGMEQAAKIRALHRELGPVRYGLIEEAQLKVVKKVRQLEEEGKISVYREDEVL
jgi:flagellar motor switch protein FliG